MRLAIVGAGKMAGALVHGLIEKRIFSAGDITGFARSDASRDRFLSIHSGLNWAEVLEDALTDADFILLGIKPFQAAEVLPQLASAAGRVCFISMLSGTPISKMSGWLGAEARIVRTMPNTPLMIGAGVTGFAAGPKATASDKEWVGRMFSALGDVYEVSEEQIDVVTGISGSGPAYFYLFTDLLRKEAERNGIDPKIALAMARQTALGAARMMAETKKEPEDLIAQVKSKGGTTEAALNSFATDNLSETVKHAVSAAIERAREMGK
jgi:pyrroline-5-carboxylate reductase